MPKKKQPAHKPLISGTVISEGAARVRISAAIATAALLTAQANYLASGNPLHLLEGFVTARRSGLPVPNWILAPLSTAFGKALASNGKLSLDEALELKPKKGQRSRWTDSSQREKDERLIWLIEKRPKLLLSLGLIETLPTVSEPGGAADQALAVLHEEGDTTYGNMESLLQRYKILKRTSRLPRS